MSCGDIFLGFVAILFPPIAVWIKSGLCSADSLINVLLLLLGYLPGLLHAWYIIAKNPEYDYEPIPDNEAQGGRITYYFVSHEQRPHRSPQNYGTQAPAVPENSRPAAPAPASAPGPSTGAGSSEPGAPPSYADAVKGDHKVQRQE